MTRTYSRGFISLGLILVLIIVAAVIGGGAYYAGSHASVLGVPPPLNGQTAVSSGSSGQNNTPAENASQPAQSSADVASCAQFANLKKGDTDASTGGKVSALQAFLGISPVTGSYGALTSIGYTNKCVGGNSSPTSVSGMSKYTDADFGFSFWYPSDWKVGPDTSRAYPNARKTLLIYGGPSDQQIRLDVIHSTNASVSIGNEAKSGVNERYYFDATTAAWMYAADGQAEVANVSNNTMGGLHFFIGQGTFGQNIAVPLTANDFVMSEPTGGADPLPLMQTIVATDPTVAIPVSTAEQMKIIQAEKATYGASVGSPSALSASPASGAAPLKVSFSGTVSSPGGSALGIGPYDFSLDFGDGQPWGSTGASSAGSCPITNGAYPESCPFGPVSHTYKLAGTYTASLVRGAQNGTKTILGWVTITVR